MGLKIADHESRERFVAVPNGVITPLPGHQPMSPYPDWLDQLVAFEVVWSHYLSARQCRRVLASTSSTTSHLMALDGAPWSHYSLATHAKPYSVGSGYRTSPTNLDAGRGRWPTSNGLINPTVNSTAKDYKRSFNRSTGIIMCLSWLEVWRLRWSGTW